MYGLVVSQWPNFQTSFHVRAWSHQKRRSGTAACCIKLAKTQRTVSRSHGNAAYGHTKNLPTLVDLLLR